MDDGMTEFVAAVVGGPAGARVGPLPPGTPRVKPAPRFTAISTSAPDDSLRRRAEACRLRLDAKGGAALTLRIAGGEASGGGPVSTRAPRRHSRAMAADTAVRNGCAASWTRRCVRVDLEDAPGARRLTGRWTES
jgi:hypothetical protein